MCMNLFSWFKVNILQPQSNILKQSTKINYCFIDFGGNDFNQGLNDKVFEKIERHQFMT